MFYNALNIFIFKKNPTKYKKSKWLFYRMYFGIKVFFYAGLGLTKDNNYLNTLTNKVLLRLNNPITLQDT